MRISHRRWALYDEYLGQFLLWARDKYHENFVLFFDNPSAQGPLDGLRAALMAEFALIWNAGESKSRAQALPGTTSN